jgi:uncharacterized damage-inducible protein DinB
MTLSVLAVEQLRVVREQFETSAGVLDERVAAFRPHEGMMTVAQHIAHAAQVIDWLVEGAFGSGFDLEFEPRIARVMAVSSVAAAKEWFASSIEQSIRRFGELGDEELMSLLPEGPVMGGMPRLAVVTAIAEHTSHHRGALAVYARLNDRVPASPYGV